MSEQPQRYSMEFLKDLQKSFKALEQSLQKKLDEKFAKAKDFMDNDSKTSSGYGDDEHNEDDNGDEVHGHVKDHPDIYNDDKDGVDVLALSDDEDYDKIWDISSTVSTYSSDGDYYDAILEISSSSDDGTSNNNIPNSTYMDKLKNKLTFFKILKTLPLYPPSEETKISKNLNFTLKSLKENNNDIIKTYISNPKLHKDNIDSVFKSLIEIEDVTCMSEYPPLAQKDVTLNATGMRRQYWINLKNCSNIEDIVTPNLDEVVLVPKASSAMSEATPLKYMTDLILPHPHENETDDTVRRRVAIVKEISKDRAYFRFSLEEHLSATQVAGLLTTKYDIIFRPSRYPLRYQHRALELLAENDEIRNYLFPCINPLRELKFEPQLELTLFNNTIASNPEQLGAVRYITEGPNPYAPYVIFGPPGTGKTTTIVESILQLRLHNPRSRILVTAGSNSACDTIALRICKYFKSNLRLRVLEIGDPVNQKSIIRIYSKSIIEKGIQIIDPELMANSNCSSGFHYYPSVKEIREYGIIVATLCTVGKLVTGDIGKMDYFTHIFMDEAGSSTEPEALVGIMGIKSNTDCRVILSGDHKQLGPILKSERAADLGLQKSLMERLINNPCYVMDENSNYDRTLQARLKRNYRSHPEIVKLYNHLYYNDELIAEAKPEDVNMAAKWCKLPNPNFPIIFQAVHGITEKDDISPSSFNNLEIQVLMWFLQRLLVDGIDGRRVAQSDIGIITPYKLQSQRIQDRLLERGWCGVEAGSVEIFQGREKQIIIVSLVRSFSGLGFLRNPKRLNVILSRPKSLLIIMGNPLTLKRQADFNFIIEECKNHGTYLYKKRVRKHRTATAIVPTTNDLAVL